jgi:two-component system, LuxR family, sensor kinase FixL
MDYGNTALSESTEALKRRNMGGVGIDAAARQSENKSATPADVAAAAACDIKHPLTAILANANAARRWLHGTDANLAETIAALERIVADVARVDAAIDGIRTILVE